MNFIVSQNFLNNYIYQVTNKNEVIFIDKVFFMKDININIDSFLDELENSF